jgi:fluoroacetyl-CoA thioesterase
MEQPFEIGAVMTYQVEVAESDTAQFGGAEVHPVYATFALARDAEWTCRQFVLDMKEDHEEGIGTHVTVNHQAPALVGEKVHFYASLTKVDNRNVICQYTAYVGERLIASGEQGQKILSRVRLNQLFESLK